MAPEVITRAKLIEGNVKNCANSNGTMVGILDTMKRQIFGQRELPP